MNSSMITHQYPSITQEQAEAGSTFVNFKKEDRAGSLYSSLHQSQLPDSKAINCAAAYLSDVNQNQNQHQYQTETSQLQVQTQLSSQPPQISGAQGPLHQEPQTIQPQIQTYPQTQYHYPYNQMTIDQHQQYTYSRQFQNQARYHYQ